MTVMNVERGSTRSTTTDNSGAYTFADLAVGHYDISMECPGFRPYRRTGVALYVNSSLLIDARLEVGREPQTVEVEEGAVHVETSDTQLGEVITGKKMTTVPLDGRSYTDLLALQPGVTPATSLTSDTQQDVGVSALSPSGGLNPGTISINGQREFANAFIVNGSDTEEDVNSGTAIIPNLDSIAEFRILTGNVNAESGEYSGGQINVVTKSGTNEFHGNAFEFLRNTDLDAKNFFSPDPRNISAESVRWHLWRTDCSEKTVFLRGLPGNSHEAGHRHRIDCGAIYARPFRQSLRYGESIDGSRQRSILGWSAIPEARIRCHSRRIVLQRGLHQFIRVCVSARHDSGQVPGPRRARICCNTYPSQMPAPIRFRPRRKTKFSADDKGASRIDYESQWGLVSLYYFLDQYSLNNPYPVAQSGASVPGFNALNTGRAQLFSLGDTKTLGSSMVNEFHASFMRANNDLGQPEGGKGISLASQGFVTGPGTPGIVPLNPAGEGVENIVFNAFSIGTNANELKQVNNTYQVLDNFSRIVRDHTLRIRRRVPLRSNQHRPHRAIQRQLSFHRKRNRFRLCRFSARHSQPIQSEPVEPLLRQKQIRRGSSLKTIGAFAPT